MKLSDIITKDLWGKVWTYLISLVVKGKNLSSWSIALLNYIGQLLWKYVKKLWESKEEQKRKAEREATQEKAKEEFDKIKNNPETSADEFGQGMEDLINTGKK